LTAARNVEDLPDHFFLVLNSAGDALAAITSSVREL
jgi:hypothetical protein